MSEIQQHIRKHPGLTANEIAEDLKMELSRVKRRLRMLEEAGSAKRTEYKNQIFWGAK